MDSVQQKFHSKMADRIELVPIDGLVPYAKNARTHSREQVDQIAASITEFGFNNPILIDSQKGIIAGHGRFMAATQLGLDRVPVVKLDHLTDAQKRAYIIADNKLALNAGWDDELLADELIALKDDGFDLEVMGFSDDELADLLPDAPEGGGGNTDDDEVPDVPENIHGVKRGEIWQLGNHRLMCGDSTSKDDVDRLMQGEKADMVFTDPPYGVSLGDDKKFVDGEIITYKKKKIENDESTEIYRLSVPIMAMFTDGPIYTWFAGTKATDLYQTIDAIGGKCHALIIWHKTNAKYKAWGSCYKQRHEPCLFWKGKNGKLNWDGPSNEPTIWEEKRDYSQGKIHPTAKPVELAERAIKNHIANNVLDLFLGSGSTLIACEKTNRKCYGMEIDPHYCSVIIERWQNFTGKKATKL